MLEELSRRLMAEFGRGFDVTNLRKMRQFYRMFEIRDAVRLASPANTTCHAVCDELSWNHYRLLMQVDNPASRELYMHEAVDQHWSTRQIERRLIDARHVYEGKRWCRPTAPATGGGLRSRGGVPAERSRRVMPKSSTAHPGGTGDHAMQDNE